ncbi:MAG: sulfatase [Bryobacteraceae bacterium]
MPGLSRRNLVRSALAAPAVAGAGRRPNIVVLVADDLSRGTLGCYGDPVVRTPRIDRLAAEGMRFERAYVTSPQCSPSRSSVFTGRAPHATGMSRLHAPLRSDVPDVVARLEARGYFCGAYRKHHMGEEFARRLDFYGSAQEKFETFFDRAPQGRPFFLWMGFTDPHRPYRRGIIENPHDPARMRIPEFLPDTPVVREDLALHYDAITRLDSDCGRVLDILEKRGLAENTLVAFFGDNGMPFPRAKASLYQPGVNVPLLVRWPGRVKPGSVSRELVSTVDLPATWLEAAGAESIPRAEGRSIAKLLEGAPHEPRRYVFTERNWHDTWDPARGVVSDRYALIANFRPEASYRGTLDHIWAPWSRGGGPCWDEIVKERKAGRLNPALERLFAKPRPLYELYDLESDPGEFRNLAEDQGAGSVLRELQKALSAWMEDTNDFLPPVSRNFLSNAGEATGLDKLLNGYLP